MPLYLKVTPAKGSPIEGDVQTRGYEKQIDVVSMGWDVTNPVSGVPSTGAALNVSGAQVSTFTLVKRPDGSSPKLFLACVKGEDLKEVVLTVTSADAAKTVLYTYTLETVKMTSMRSTIEVRSRLVRNDDGTMTEFPESVLTEKLSFRYAKITVSYTKADGNKASETYDAKGIS